MKPELNLPIMVHKLLATRAALYPTKKCIGSRVYHPECRGHYQYYSYADTVHLISQLCVGLQKLGFKKNDLIGILSQNRMEWTVIDVACGALGLVLVPLYDTQSVQDCEYVLQTTQLKIIFVELSKL